MTGGLGFVKSGQNSLDSNRKLINKDRNFKNLKNSNSDKQQLKFKKATKEELDVFKEKIKNERIKENMKNWIIASIVFGLIIIMGLIFKALK